MHTDIAKRLTGLFLLIMTLPVFAGALDENEQRMVEWIDAHSDDAISLLEETVNISSGTMNHEGVRKVGDVMQRELDALGLETEWIELPPELERAGHLFGRKLYAVAYRMGVLPKIKKLPYDWKKSAGRLPIRRSGHKPTVPGGNAPGDLPIV